MGLPGVALRGRNADHLHQRGRVSSPSGTRTRVSCDPSQHRGARARHLRGRNADHLHQRGRASSPSGTRTRVSCVLVPRRPALSPYGDRTRVSSVKTRYPDHWTKGDLRPVPPRGAAPTAQVPRGTDRCGIRTHARRLVPETSALDHSAKRPSAGSGGWCGAARGAAGLAQRPKRDTRPGRRPIKAGDRRRARRIDDDGIRTHARRPVP